MAIPASRYGFDLLSQAIDLGHTFAMNELGYFLEGGDHADAWRGLRYLKEAAARNDSYGYNNLGLVYDKGLGAIEPDPAVALHWYTRAFEAGHPFAAVNIGRMHWKGRFGTPEPVKAVEWYDRGLERGDPWGGANAAWIIANEGPRGFSPADAAVRAAKAAAPRDAEAAAAAHAVLRGLDRQALETAVQMLIREFDPSQVVDGVIGPKTLEAMTSLAAAHGFRPPPDDPLERLLLLAKMHWRENPICIDPL